MKLSLSCLALLLSVSVFACATKDDAVEVGSGTDDVTSGGKVTLTGLADTGLRADLRDAIGEPTATDAIDLTGVIHVEASTSQDYLRITDTTWRLAIDAKTKTAKVSFPDTVSSDRTAKKLFDAMKKGSKETKEGEFADIVRTSPAGRVVCTHYSDIDGNPGSYECVIGGITEAGNGS